MMHLAAAAVLVSLLTPVASAQAEPTALKEGWTEAAVASEADECTKQLVEGAWENTKRKQGADPSLPMSDEIRKQLEPQIAAMKSLCSCAITAAAGHYTKAEADKTPDGLDAFIAETIASGACQLAPGK
jgi:hypothetical protein